MVKKDIKKEILSLLEKEKKGLSIKRLANALGASRTTVSKYLDILLEEEKVENETISHLKFWKIKDSDQLRSNFSFWQGYDAFINAILSAYPEIMDGRKLGREVAKNLRDDDFLRKFIPFEDVNILLDKYEEYKKRHDLEKKIPEPELSQLADSFREIFNKTRLLVDKGVFDPPTVIKNPPTVILRNKGQRFLDEFLAPPNQDFKFEVIAGILEQLLLLLKIQVTIQYDRRVKDKIVDMIISIE